MNIYKILNEILDLFFEFGVETIYIVYSLFFGKIDWIGFFVAIGFLSWIIYNYIDTYIIKKRKNKD